MIIDALNKRQRLLSKFIIPFYCTDDYRVYSANLPREKYIIGKSYKQRIERTNLTLRARLKQLVRKTVGFSRLEDRLLYRTRVLLLIYKVGAMTQ